MINLYGGSTLQLVVKEMKILTTVFLKRDNEMVFYPNYVLLTKPISNLRRSPEMKDFFDFTVHISTSTEQISAFKGKIAG
jgi:small-conductance mechanosensitive channel